MAEPSFRRYRPATGSEAEVQPGSRGRVMRNKLGIVRKREIDVLEYDALITTQVQYLSQIGPKTRFTAALLRQMHKDWLGGIYAWAGDYRTVNLTKGEFTWPPAIRVPDNMLAFEAGLLREHTPCRPGSLDEVAAQLAIIHAEFLLIHPFREGNGRLARWLADLMAAQAGFSPPHYRFAGPGSVKWHASYIQDVQQGYLRNYAPLTRFFAAALERSLMEEG